MVRVIHSSDQRHLIAYLPSVLLSTGTDRAAFTVKVLAEQSARPVDAGRARGKVNKESLLRNLY